MPSVTGLKNVLDIGSRRELLVDDFLIESLTGRAEQRLQHPTPREAVLSLGQPWEGNRSTYNTVINDNGLFRMYYQGTSMKQLPEGITIPPFGQDDVTFCYAESTDGIKWHKPTLGVYSFDGSKENNLVRVAQGSHGFSPFLDTNPDCLPDERYKAFGRSRVLEPDSPQDDRVWRSLFAMTSPDGVHWHVKAGPKRHGAILDRDEGNFDSQNGGFWDEVDGVYRLYFRKMRLVENRSDLIGRDDGDGGVAQKPKMRDIVLATSRDFVNWQVHDFLEYPGAADEELYSNQVIRYPRAPHLFVGFPPRYVENRGPLTSWHEKMLQLEPGRRHQSYTDGVFMTSRDGRSFHRWPEAFMRPLPSEEARWGYGECYLNRGLIETKSDIPGAMPELSMFAGEGRMSQEGACIRRYTIRPDGFVAIEAPMAGGGLLTRPLTFTGDTLFLNMSTSSAGGVWVEIQDQADLPIKGFTFADCACLFGNALDKPVRWASSPSLSHLAGQPVRLCFRLQDAELFAFRFGKAGN